MPQALIRTGNKKWFLAKNYLGGATSERGALVDLIKLYPGITTDELQAKAIVVSRVPSRLAELEKEGFLRSEFICDLFK